MSKLRDQCQYNECPEKGTEKFKGKLYCWKHFSKKIRAKKIYGVIMGIGGLIMIIHVIYQIFSSLK